MGETGSGTSGGTVGGDAAAQGATEGAGITSLSRASALAGAGLLLLLVAFAAVFVGHESALSNARKWVAHTYEVLDGLTTVQQAAADVSAAGNAWLRTGDAADLTGYEARRAQGAAAARQVQTLVADNPPQATRAATLIDLLERLPPHPDAGLADRIEPLRGKALEMIREERALLRLRDEEAQRTDGWLVLLGGLGMVAALIGVGLALVLILNQARTRRHLMEAADAANIAKSRFLASMSHELRTPLNAIIGFTEVMRGPLPDAERQRYLAYLSNAARSLLSLINDILDLSKIEAGKLDLLPAPFEPARLVEECRSLIGPAASERGLTLDVRLDPGLAPWVMGDAQRVRQILLNLLSNAVKFTAKGFVTLTVTPLATGKSPAGGLRLVVRDTGSGISREQQARLFTEFTQLSRNAGRPQEGTGLGLAISRSLTLQMGGNIGVESEPGRGSTFWVELPLAAVAAPAVEQAAAAAAMAGPARILMVEDIEANQVLARKVLESAGHDVTLAGNGQIALERCRDQRFDLILMDVEMPVMDGLQATRELRAQGGHWARVPIVALTAHAIPTEIARCTAAGMDGHIAKPYLPSEMIAQVNRFLSRQEPAAMSSAPDPAVPVVEQSTVDELVKLLGQAELDMLLRELVKRLTDLGAVLGATAPDPASLRRDAHALISQSGNLGFQELSVASRRLCDTIRGPDWTDEASARLGDVRAAADRALAELGRRLKAA